jgi:quercetin dioxygenase-like cupin family protein
MSPTTLAPPAVAEQLWFLDTLVTIRVPHDAGEDGISVTEWEAPFGDSPPLHVHRTEDEVFQVLDGELLVRSGDEDIVARQGDVLLAPKGIPHTYRVISPQGARFVVTTTRGDFERVVRAVARPAADAQLPDPSGPPSPEQVGALAAICAAHGIDLVGPPLA